MPPQQSKSAWFDPASHTSLIADQARRAESFVAAMADGRIDDSEIKAQESRVVALMQEIEPTLDGPLHDKVTKLLCELTVYDFMQSLYAMQQARPKSVFRG